MNSLENLSKPEILQPKAPPLRAITLHRPWPYAVTNLGKRIENRTWPCPMNPGDYLAIHAGKQWIDKAADWLETQFLADVGEDEYHPTGIVAICRFGGNIQESDDPWFFGPYGWVLTDIVPIIAVPCPGQQRLWTVPDRVLPLVRQRFELARSA